VAPFLLALFKGAPVSTRAFVASSLPVRADKCSGIEFSAFVKSTYIPLSSKILIISTLPARTAE
jgi:hypothetical protein